MKSYLKHIQSYFTFKRVLLSIGSFLIILSTFMTGYFIYQNQNEESIIHSNIASFERQVDKIDHNMDAADLISSLAYLGRVNTYDKYISKSIDQKLFNREFIASIYYANVRLMQTVDSIKSLDKVRLHLGREKALKGDFSGVYEMYEVFYSTLNILSEFKGSLHKKINSGELRLIEIKRTRNILSFVSLCCQIFGLVIMLFAEMNNKK